MATLEAIPEPDRPTRRTSAEHAVHFLSQLSAHEGTARTLLIAAHPDDETIGAGAIIPHLAALRIVHVTDGSPLNMADALAAGFSTREAYAAAREKEAKQALVLAGVPEDAISNLHFTDQQVVFHIQELTERIVELVEVYKPKSLLTHAYEGGHPDHDSVAFACHLAREIHRGRNPDAGFEVVEFAGYRLGDGAIRAYEFLPRENHSIYEHTLTLEERGLKIQMLRTFRTQSKTLTPFLSPRSEMFRKAPNYDFGQAPHAGRLFYERFDWGVDGERWRKLAAQARARLGI